MGFKLQKMRLLWDFSKQTSCKGSMQGLLPKEIDAFFACEIDGRGVMKEISIVIEGVKFLIEYETSVVDPDEITEMMIFAHDSGQELTLVLAHSVILEIEDRVRRREGEVVA